MRLIPPVPTAVLRTLARGWTICGEALGDLVFPWSCVGCGAEAEGWQGPFCPGCRGRLLAAAGAWAACPRCAMPVGPYADLRGGCARCRKTSLGFDQAVALSPYDGTVRDLCLRLKHERDSWLAPWAGGLVVDARRVELSALPADAWVVPVPLHWWRRLRRGYNQADALADALAGRLGLRVRHALRRVRATDRLSHLGATDRFKAMRGAFAARRAADLKGRTVLLVDDILTTGATSSEAARVLKRAGARRVVLAVVARTLDHAPADSRVVNRATEFVPWKPDLVAPHPHETPRPTPMDPPTSTIVRIGTRGSRLARWQAEWVADRLRESHPGLTVELVEIRTHGDRDRNSPLAAIGGTGLFTKEIQRAVLEGAVDLAVHSLKDLPTGGPDGLVLAAVPPREDVADALIAPAHRTLVALPPGARVGTSSLRRRAQLLDARPGLEVVTLRGNVETRLNHALEGKLDAVVLAWAGLHRLGLEGHVTQRLEPPAFLPAVGQGALGIECRRDDAATRERLLPLDDPATHRAVVAERMALAELEGGCLIPMAAWARDLPGTDRLALAATVFDPDGTARVDAALDGPRDDPGALGRLVAEALRTGGAEQLLKSLRRPG